MPQKCAHAAHIAYLCPTQAQCAHDHGLDANDLTTGPDGWVAMFDVS